MNKTAFDLLAVARELVSDSDGLRGMKKSHALRFIRGLCDKHTRGFFHDSYWKPIHACFKELERHGIDVVLASTEYFKNDKGVPSSKVWRFTIEFENEKGRTTTLYGMITAAGAGSVDDPLDRYDVTMVIS